jgi:single-stranded DNA-specific DHH superfamily exonuclease
MITKDPSEYYFAVVEAVDNYAEEYNLGSYIFIVRIDFWNKNRRLDDRHLNIDDLLPEEISEDMESLFSSSDSIEESRKKMLERGFKENEEFSKFVEDVETWVY